MAADGSHDELGPEALPEELVALADGLLSPVRAAQIEAQAAASPDLAARLAAQRRGVSALRAAAAEAAGDGAPSGLRARIEADRRPAPRRRSLLGGLAVAAAILAALAVFLLPGGSGGPTVAQAAELGARPAEGAAPRPLADRPALLDLSVASVAFPAWDREFGWRAGGQRTDDLEGREARTVAYAKEGKRLGYTIVSGDALDDPDDARAVTRDGVDLQVFSHDGRLAVTWLRGGHTCVLSGAGVDEDTLTKLAVWKGAGAVTF